MVIEQAYTSERFEKLHNQGKLERLVTVTIPGSTANLGPGFDALGLALGIYTKLSIAVLKEDDPAIPRISLGGTTGSTLPTDDNNLVFSLLREMLHFKPDLIRRVRLYVETDIPLGRGLGSSASALLGALWAGRVLAGTEASNDTLLSLGLRYEGHADNLAASLHGGLVVCAPSIDNRRVVIQKMKWPDQWKTLLIVPPYMLSTQEARSVLPKNFSRADAVENIQRVALLLAAVANEDEAAMKEALADKIHEPYRSPLVLELESAKRELKSTPAMGCVLSGAGSSILIVYHQRNEKEIKSTVENWAAKQSSKPAILNLEVDNKGMSFHDQQN